MAQPPREERIVINYVEPANQAHVFYRDLLQEHRALERMRDHLSLLRWPSQLRLEVRSCNGESNAWYDDGVVTVCYEFLADFWNGANGTRHPPPVDRDHAFVGPFLDTFFHEAGHAMFEQFKIPLFGREEDAADHVAAYLMLQFPKTERRALILGAAYSYASEIKVRTPRDLNRLRIGFKRHVTAANEHATPAQRLYSLLCIAYGSDKELFADVVARGYLPRERAEQCEDEYRQVAFAYKTLIAPHQDTVPDPAK